MYGGAVYGKTFRELGSHPMFAPGRDWRGAGDAPPPQSRNGAPGRPGPRVTQGWDPLSDREGPSPNSIGIEASSLIPAGEIPDGLYGRRT